MAGPIYSTRLIAAHDQPANTPIDYVVPAGLTLVVRCIDCYAGVTVLGVNFYARGSASQVFFKDSTAPTSDGWRQWTGREVLYEGETFALVADDVADLSASGYLLS